MSKDADQALKILIIGPSNVGKSALLKRYCDNDFDLNDAAATIGIDYRVKRLSVRGKTYRVTLLDTAGQERFRTLSTSYYRGAHGIVFVYDLTNRATFAQMDTWFAEAEANTAATSSGLAGGGPGCQYCLVAAKLDRAGTGRAVSREEGLALAGKYSAAGNERGEDGERSEDRSEDRNVLFFETSARTGENVRAPFVALVDRIVTSGAADAAARQARPATGGTVSLVSGAVGGVTSYLPSMPGCSC